MRTTPPSTGPVDKESRTGASPLRAAREANGYGLRQTAREAGLDPSQLARIEAGAGGLTVANLFRLGEVLGLRGLVKHLRPFVANSPRPRP